MEGVGIPPNIAAAIRRSQAARRAMRAQRRRAGIVVAALCLGTAVPVSLTFADSGGSDMLEAAVSKAQGLVDMLNQRSPGQRIAAQLTKTKHKQMALAKVRAPGPAAPDAHELAKILLGQPVLPVALAAAPIPPVDLVPPTLEAIVAPSPGNAIIIPPSGGGGGGVIPGGGGPPATNPTPQPHEPVVPPPVPEPATWMTMLLGFALIGWSIRRCKAAQPRLAV